MANATLTLTVGGLTSTKTVDAHVFQQMVDGYIRQKGGFIPPAATNQQKLDYVATQMANDFRDAAKAGKQILLNEAAATDLSGWVLT